MGRWTLIEDANGNDLVGSTFYGAGFRYAVIDYLNGTESTFGYNGFRYLTAIDHTDSGSTTFAGFDYGYDKMGNPLWVEHVHYSGAGNLYAHDKAYRLTSALMGSADPSAEAADNDWADYPHVKKIAYNMDDVSNRTSKVETPYQGSSTSLGYAANCLNQYTQIGGVSRTHDDNGNLTDNGTYDFAYDYRNNLVKVMCGQLVVSECVFDALGRRTSQITLGGGLTSYFYDGEHIVEEYDGSDELLRKFVYGQEVDDIRVMISPDYADVDDDQNTSEILNFYFHHDMLGTVTHVTGSNGSVVERYDYQPYGQVSIKDGSGNDLNGVSGIRNPYMFAARRFDEETGLYHQRRRALDPETGRFLQRDPYGYVDGLGLFTYALSRPTSATDAYGLSTCTSSGTQASDNDWDEVDPYGESNSDLMFQETPPTITTPKPCGVVKAWFVSLGDKLLDGGQVADYYDDFENWPKYQQNMYKSNNTVGPRFFPANQSASRYSSADALAEIRGTAKGETGSCYWTQDFKFTKTYKYKTGDPMSVKHSGDDLAGSRRTDNAPVVNSGQTSSFVDTPGLIVDWNTVSANTTGVTFRLDLTTCYNSKPESQTLTPNKRCCVEWHIQVTHTRGKGPKLDSLGMDKEWCE